MKLVHRMLLAALGGVLYFLAFPAYSITPLVWVAFVPLLIAIDGETAKRAALLGALFGFVQHMGGYPWLIDMFMEFAGLPKPAAVVGYVGFCALHGVLYGLFGWLVCRMARHLPRLLVAPVALVAAEQLFPRVFQHYTAVILVPNLNLLQLAEVAGPHGLTALVGVVNAAIVALIRSRGRHWKGLAASSVAVGLAVGYGALRIASVDARVALAETMPIGIAQNGFGGFFKNQEVTVGLLVLQEQTQELADQGAELVVWPEAAYASPVPEEAKAVPRGVQGDAGVPILFGALRRGATQADGWTPLYSSAILAAADDGEVLGTYDKRTLLIFGEYLPFGEVFPVLYQYVPTSRLGRGVSTAPLVLGDVRFATYICYEAILPSTVYEIARDEAGPPHVLINLTNDSWYGQGMEQSQHLALSILRTVELRRPMVRATNTGISAIVDPVGRVVVETGNHQKDTAIAPVPLVEGGLPLAAYIGEPVGWLVSLLALIGAFLPLRRKGSDGS